MEANLWLSAAADLAQIRVRVPNHVVYQSFVAETVLLDLETGTHHELDGNAGRLLEVLSPAAASSLRQRHWRRRGPKVPGSSSGSAPIYASGYSPSA